MNRVFLCLIVIIISFYFILTEQIFAPLQKVPDTIAVQVMYEDKIKVVHVAPYSTIGDVLKEIELDEEMLLSGLNHNQILVDQDVIRIPKADATTCISLNTASLESLQMIPGVGEKTAQAIIAYREEHGAFTSIDDLLNIKGIGEKKLEKMRDTVCL